MMMNENGRDYQASFITREDGDKKYIEGYFVRFDDKYELWGDCYETIAPNAFDETLNKDIVSLWNHDSNYPLGRTTNGTLTLRVDNSGLFGKVEINENDSFAKDAYERIKRGDVKQCSFGFRILSEEYIQHDNGETEYRITKVDLWEVSPVTFPAYKSTTISARKEDLKARQERHLETMKNKSKERIDNIVKGIETK